MKIFEESINEKKTGICKYIQWINIDRQFRRDISKAKEENNSYLRNDENPDPNPLEMFLCTTTTR